MGEVGAADRSRLLRSKRAQLRCVNAVWHLAGWRVERRIDPYRETRADLRSGIVTSRKRKLREFFAVCDNDGPLPQIKYENPDAPPTSAAEARFLEVCDVLQYVWSLDRD
jgi:chromatin modification-related protein VID21